MYTGLVGALKTENAFGEFTDIAYISGWSVDEKAEMIDCSEFGSADKNSIAGAKSWSASADGTICFNKVGGYDELFEAYCLGKPISFHFHLSDGNIEGKENTYLCGSGYIESISVKLSSGDIGTASVSVAGVGPLEMFVNDKNIMSDRAHRVNTAIALYVGGDGHMYAEIPDYLDDRSVWVDESSGRLYIKI
ncbi:MAG: hypothetical protein HFJ21_05195 [Clostridia bacterium]|jgi:Phage major tail protein 2.|nr:hypothetical protein [Clostridia bacterium]